MKRILVIIILLITIPLLAQDPKGWQLADFYSEIGRLHVQITQASEYIQTLQARIKVLEEENKTLKEKVPDVSSTNPAR